jgi:transcriptional regulator with XRE-family HTH domain
MARARPGLAQAINDILIRHGKEGKRLSFRQAERVTGLAPATISELAKGNARTPETVRRFAQGFGEDIARLLLLAGFVPEEEAPLSARPATPVSVATAEGALESLELDTREWLGRMGRALSKMPPGRERELWKERLRRDTELLEAFLARLTDEEETQA